MFLAKSVFYFVILCFFHKTLGKPTESEITQPRGIGSTIWSWLTYPFSWWSTDQPTEDQVIDSTTYIPAGNVEIDRHNVTVWCNNQTCTTMRCNEIGCKNTTCNIYDTNLNGECHEYNLNVKPEEPVTVQTTHSEYTTSPVHNILEVTTNTDKINQEVDTNKNDLTLVVTTENVVSQNVDDTKNKNEAVATTELNTPKVQKPQSYNSVELTPISNKNIKDGKQ